MKPRVIGHVSDLIMCRRQRVFQELDPRKPTEKQMNLYSSGGSMHQKTQEMQATDRARFEKEYLVYFKGLSGSVDVYDKLDNVPLEYKTPRKDGPLKEPQPYNLEQLRTYMAMLGSDWGYLEYQFFAAKKINYQPFWIYMTADERAAQLRDMLQRLDNLRLGVKLEEPAATEGVYDDPTKSWLCYDCPYVHECEQMR